MKKKIESKQGPKVEFQKVWGGNQILKVENPQIGTSHVGFSPPLSHFSLPEPLSFSLLFSFGSHQTSAFPPSTCCTSQPTELKGVRNNGPQLPDGTYARIGRQWDAYSSGHSSLVRKVVSDYFLRWFLSPSCSACPSLYPCVLGFQQKWPNSWHAFPCNHRFEFRSLPNEALF